MATRFIFNGKEISIPGAYSQIKSGIRNPSLALEFGNALLINTGSERFFSGGSGINGTLKNGKDAHNTFDNVRNFRQFVGGGLWWLLSGPMFAPGGGATGGISSLTVIDAATTVPAQIQLLFGAQESDTDSDSLNDGSLTVQVRAEGFGGNGVLGDETRAQSTITITNAGAAGNVIAITVDGNVIGSYTVQTGDNIAAVVQGLAAAIDELGLSEVVSTNSTQIVIYAPRGYGAELNTISPTVGVTGSVAGSAAAFSGGIEGSILTRGYGARITQGELDSSKVLVKFYRGTFKGTDAKILLTGTPNAYDGIDELSCVPELLVQSPEVTTVQELINWMNDESGAGYDFNVFFKLASSSVGTTDEILPQDITYPYYIKATGGSSTFSSGDLDDVLTSIEDLTFDSIIADDFGDNARSANNIAIHDWIVNTAKIKPDLYVAAGSEIGDWNSGSNSSIATAVAYDSQYVTVVHGGAKKIDVGNRAYRSYASLYKAAVVMGREAGIEPQNPLTFKNIGIDGEVHMLTEKEVKLGLTKGVLMSRLDNSSFEVIKGINTLQNNAYLVNADGSTHSKQFARIERQLNKELIFNAKTALLKKPNGANRNTLSVEDVKAFVEGYLGSKVATDLDDNLLISFRAIEVTRSQDAYNVTYAFEPNSEISFLFFTGVAIDPSSNV